VTNNYNCMFGNFAGRNFNSGSENIFIGYNAQNLGVAADTWNNISNSIAVGSNTLVLARDKFILGNNSQKVGIGLSNDVVLNGPRSPLEINADPLSTVIPTNPSAGSGLRFRQLTSASPTGTPSDTWVAPYGQVLTVDAGGIVKLTDGGGVPFGACNVVPLMETDMAVDLNDNRIFYKGNFSSSGFSGDMLNSIGVGYACGDHLKAKFNVYQNATLSNGEETSAGYFHNESEDYGGLLNYKRGLWAISNGYSSSQYNIAGDFSADSSVTVNIALQGIAGSQANDLFTSSNAGGQFTADYAYENIGVNAWVGGNGSRNFALQLNAPPGACTTGTCTNGAAFVDGDIYQASGSYYTTSDQALKENIQPLQNPLAVIKSLEPKSYNFRTNEYPYLSLASGTQEGLIAQDVEAILPNLVKMYAVPSRPTRGGIDTSGAGQTFRSINYIGLIPYLIGAIKQQQESIDSLRTQIADAQSQIDNCCHSGQREQGNNGTNQENQDSRSTISVELTDVNTIILDQNSPNPFSEETYINYTIPSSVSKAVIMIYDNLGQVLRTVVISERGEGALHIYSDKLSSGIYTYSLIADGKTIDTKKMVCNK
jgi:hypothetical protein